MNQSPEIKTQLNDNAYQLEGKMPLSRANPAILANMPQPVQLIFGGSGIVPAALIALILNIVLNQ